jgi:hypothetical protein
LPSNRTDSSPVEGCGEDDLVSQRSRWSEVLAGQQDGSFGTRPARVPLGPLLDRAFELGDKMTFYDALHVALAETLGAPLYTIDSKFAGVPSLRCHVEVIR